MGYYKVNQNGRTLTIWLCKANAIWAEIFFYKDKETNEEMAQFVGFAIDLKHVKICDERIQLFTCSGAKNTKTTSIVYYAKNMTQEHWEAVKYLTKESKRKYSITIK